MTRDLVTIAIYRSQGEALLAKGLLESAGIECFLANETAGRIKPDGLILDFELWVREGDAEAARELLQSPAM
jgi:hypothetical protein